MRLILINISEWPAMSAPVTDWATSMASTRRCSPRRGSNSRGIVHLQLYFFLSYCLAVVELPVHLPAGARAYCRGIWPLDARIAALQGEGGSLRTTRSRSRSMIVTAGISQWQSFGIGLSRMHTRF